MNRIAQDAGVSIKTLYRHFENRDELFGAMIAGLCVYPEDLAADPPWSEQLPEMAPDEVALYRVIIRTAPASHS